MKKPFDRAEICPNDDGTFSVRICPIMTDAERKKSVWPEDKKLSAKNLNDAFSKIKGFAPSSNKKASDMKEYFGMKDEK